MNEISGGFSEEPYVDSNQAISLKVRQHNLVPEGVTHQVIDEFDVELLLESTDKAVRSFARKYEWLQSAFFCTEADVETALRRPDAPVIPGSRFVVEPFRQSFMWCLGGLAAYVDREDWLKVAEELFGQLPLSTDPQEREFQLNALAAATIVIDEED